jgi:hypothetical protein
MQNITFETREDYLTEAVNLLLDDVIMPAVEALGYSYDRPKFRISVGFPPGNRGGKAVAVCYKREVSTDGVNEIFVTPERDDPMQVLGDVAHEVIHAVDDCESGHQNFFAKVARKIGLEGKLTSTVAGADLLDVLAGYVDFLGAYPHHKMEIAKIKKDGTRQLKVKCHECDMTFRTSQKWINKIDTWTAHCPCCDSTGTLRVG